MLEYGDNFLEAVGAFHVQVAEIAVPEVGPT